MYSSQSNVGIGDELWLEVTVAISIFLFSIIFGAVLGKFIFPLVIRLTNRTRTSLDTRLVLAVRRPVGVGVMVLGGYLALTVPLDLSQGSQNVVGTIAGLLGIIVVVTAVASLLSAFIGWYLEIVAPRTETTLDEQLFPLLRKVLLGVVYSLGVLLVLDQLNINISPLIAGLGLGGLAVGLALQPTLANLFAGTYVMTEGVIAEGDYVELENGISGYVVGVGWRSTHIRTWLNNLVVVPNSKFADTMITNYHQPVLPVNVFLTCGVGYGNDLERVERVCMEVMNDLLDTNDGAVKEYGAWFGYDSFGESNVNFWLFIQAKDRLASYEVQSDLVKRLHGRLKEEEIVINYPVRSLQFPKGWETEVVASVNRRRDAHISSDPGDASDGIEGPKRG